MLTTFVYVNAFLNGVISFFSIVSNIIIITAFAKTKSLQNVNNTFLIQLTLADLLKSICILPIKVYNQCTDQEKFNEFYCEISGMIITVGTIWGVLLLAAIAVVRYYKVVQWQNFNAVFSSKKVAIYSGVIISCTFTLAALPVMGIGRYTYSKFHGACFTSWAAENILFRSLFYILIVVISYPVLIFCYGKIFCLLRNQRRLVASCTDTLEQRPATFNVESSALGTKRESAQSDHTATSTNECPVSADPDSAQTNNNTTKEKIEVPAASSSKQNAVAHHEDELPCKVSGSICERKRETRRRAYRTNKEITVTRIMFMGVIAYAICWSPASITTILSLSKLIKPPDILLYTIVTIVEMKLALNPLIYGILNSQFRRAITNLLWKRYRR